MPYSELWRKTVCRLFREKANRTWPYDDSMDYDDSTPSDDSMSSSHGDEDMSQSPGKSRETFTRPHHAVEYLQQLLSEHPLEDPHPVHQVMTVDPWSIQARVHLRSKMEQTEQELEIMRAEEEARLRAEHLAANALLLISESSQSTPPIIPAHIYPSNLLIPPNIGMDVDEQPDIEMAYDEPTTTETRTLPDSERPQTISPLCIDPRLLNYTWQSEESPSDGTSN